MDGSRDRRAIRQVNPERNNGLAAILTANVFFGVNIPVTRSLITTWMTPMGYTVTRMLFGALVFWVIGLFQKDERVSPKDMGILAIGGLLGYLGTQFLFSLSLQHTTPMNFSMLMALTPVVVLLLSAILLKERVPIRKAFGVFVSVVGACAMIYWSGTASGTGPHDGRGILYALGCVLCYGSYLLLTRQVSQRYKPVTVAKWMFLFSALVLLPFIGSGLRGQAIYSNAADAIGIAQLAFALLFSTTLAFFLMPLALKKLEASTVSIFMNLQPIVASVVAIAVGQDEMSWDKVLAAVFVLVGVYLVTRPTTELITSKASSETEAPPPEAFSTSR